LCEQSGLGSRQGVEKMAEKELMAIEPVPEQRVDPLLYRLVVGALAGGLLAVVVGGLVLAGLGRDVPAALYAIGAACGGSLGGLLAPSPVK
jgi:hypothetical protein